MPEPLPLRAWVKVISGRYRDSEGCILGPSQDGTYPVALHVRTGSGHKRKELHFTESQLVVVVAPAKGGTHG